MKNVLVTLFDVHISNDSVVVLFDVHISNDNVVVLYTDIFCIFIVRYDKIDLIQKPIVLFVS